MNSLNGGSITDDPGERAEIAIAVEGVGEVVMVVRMGEEGVEMVEVGVVEEGEEEIIIEKKRNGRAGH